MPLLSKADAQALSEIVARLAPIMERAGVLDEAPKEEPTSFSYFDDAQGLTDATKEAQPEAPVIEPADAAAIINAVRTAAMYGNHTLFANMLVGFRDVLKNALSLGHNLL